MKSQKRAVLDCDVVVIGSGAGGLAAAVALARGGRKVLVLEQHYLPGGWCHSFTLEGYQFSPGVHYIGQLQPGGRMRAIYEGLGVSEDLTFLELNPDGFDHVILGADRFDIPKGKERYAEKLKARFPHEARGIDGCLDAIARLGAEIDSGMHVRGLSDMLAFPWRYPAFTRWGWRSLDRFLDGFVKDPVLRGILSIQAGDHGMAPSRASAALHAAVVAHYFDGAWYPMGGGRAIPRAFVRALKRHGGDIRLRAEVRRIRIERGPGGPRAVGVVLADGTEIRAGAVVSNADPEVTFGRLMAEGDVPGSLRRRLGRTTWSISCLSLFMATDLDVRALHMDSGNYWYGRTPRVEDAYDFARRKDLASSGPIPGTFLTVTTLKDPSKRHDGIHTMESFAFVSGDSFARFADSRYGKRPADYEALKEALADRMLETIETFVPGLSRHLVFRSLGTPLTNSHYVAASRGNLYGIEKTLSQIGPRGFPVRPPIAGLYLCGASTLSHGVAGATASGLAAARHILHCRTSELLTAGGPALQTYPSDDPAAWPAELGPRAQAVAVAG